MCFRLGLFLAVIAGTVLVVAFATSSTTKSTSNNNLNNNNRDMTEEQPKRLPFCPPKKARNENVLIVSTLDGKITALDGSKNVPLWSVTTEPGEMLSSTISQLELTNNAKWVKLIPSLAGGLYKFDGESVEAVPLSAETLLKTSFKFADNTIITGGKESRTYGIEMQTGKIRYECSLDGCEQNIKDDENDFDVLILQRETQTVRAVEPRNGQEKWNFSVSQHHVDFNPGYCDNEITTDLNEEDFQYKAVVSEGVICSVNTKSPDVINWSHRFTSPIVHAWRLAGGKLVKVDLFSSSSIPDHAATIGEEPPPKGDTPLLYIGTHNNQLYIQESSKLEDDRRRMKQPFAGDELHLSDDGAGNYHSFPKVTWRPYLISSDKRTTVFNHGAKTEKMPMLTYDREASETTALSVFSGNGEYPFDSGLYLFPEEPDLTYDPVLDYHDEGSDADNQRKTTTEAPNVSRFQDQNDDDDDFDDNEFDDSFVNSVPIQIVFVSLSYYWKEVAFISILTAILINIFFARPLVNGMRRNFRNRLEMLARRRPEVYMVEVPVPVVQSTPQLQQQAESANMLPTPSTANTDSSGKFSWGNMKESEGGEFQSRFLTDFEPMHCLGKGGFGVVFECTNRIDDNRYAVKRIRLPQIEEAKKKVMREVKTLAKLDHRHIVRYFNTWLETPPNGWQESQDQWWIKQLAGEPTRTGASPLYSSINNKPVTSMADYGDEDDDDDDSSDGGVEFREQTGLHLRAPERCLNDDSFSIRFENDEDSASSSRPLLQSQESVDCDEALEWDQRRIERQRRESEREGRKSNSYLYIVMQLCQKESLRDWLRSCTIERCRLKSLEMFHQICLGVEYVHGKGLIHRDLKPSNIFFSSDGTIKIGDFGLVTSDADSTADQGDGGNNSNTLRRSKSAGQHTDEVGTELYMSPEQLQRRPYDQKVDVYSLGLILFELVVPFSTQMERVRTISDLRKSKFPSHFLNEPEYGLVRDMLTQNPEKRPEVADVLHVDYVKEAGVRINEETENSRRTRRKTTSQSSFEE